RRQRLTEGVQETDLIRLVAEQERRRGRYPQRRRRQPSSAIQSHQDRTGSAVGLDKLDPAEARGQDQFRSGERERSFEAAGPPPGQVAERYAARLEERDT